MPEHFSRSETRARKSDLQIHFFECFLQTLPRESKEQPKMMPQCFSRSETRKKNRTAKFVCSRVSTNSGAGIKRTAKYDATALFEVQNELPQNSFFACFYKLCRGHQKNRGCGARARFVVRNARKHELMTAEFVFRAFVQTAEYDARFGSSVGPRRCAVSFRNFAGIVRGFVFISVQFNT